MKSHRKIGLVLLSVVALVAGVVSPAAAEVAQPQPPPPALQCAGGLCQITGAAAGPLGLLQLGANLALTQLPFTTTADGATQATLDAQKDLTLSLPIGQLTLTNARLQVEVAPDGKISRLNGSADMPFPTFGLLNDVNVVTPARASVGLDLGKNIPLADGRLQPDRPYLFFNANSFMAVAGRAPGSSEPASLAFTPGQRLTLVVDTVDPVAYLDGQVTLSLTDQIALLGGILESTPLGPYVPDTLPLRERTQYGLSGTFNKDIAKSRLTLRGGYVVDAGLLPAQLGVDAQAGERAGRADAQPRRRPDRGPAHVGHRAGHGVRRQRPGVDLHRAQPGRRTEPCKRGRECPCAGRTSRRGRRRGGRRGPVRAARPTHHAFHQVRPEGAGSR